MRLSFPRHFPPGKAKFHVPKLISSPPGKAMFHVPKLVIPSEKAKFHVVKITSSEEVIFIT